ncbi:hypothetical protein [Aeromonas tecta]|uniref:hypothetical protein n=1 Tax=Aeromonas tecta TaxID=324617 RepID=UPI000680EBFE|nr:hypothetical protein [Aeromonas tecta]
MSSHRPVTPPDPLSPPLSDPNNFSLILGGPLYQLWSKAHLGDIETHIRRRILVLSGLCWLPLLLLCALEGSLLQGVAVPFLLDVETHVRFLVCVSLLVYAELIVHLRIRLIVRQFIDRGLVSPLALPRFYDAIRSAMAWRNSIPVEVGFILFVFSMGYFIRINTFTLQASTWYATMHEGSVTLTLPGFWFFWVSNPIIQFLILRWLYRITIWTRFLWQVSRISLDLIPTHPDRNCGLGFLGASAYAYSPLLIAFGAQLAGFIANRIFYDGALLTTYKPEIILLASFGLLLVLAPLSVFAPHIMAAKRQGLREYGALAAEYSRSFERRWLRTADRDGESLLGAADIQSLADLGNAYTVIKEVRPMPFNRDMFLQLILAAIVPFIPLLLTMFPFDVLLDRLIGVIF